MKWIKCGFPTLDVIKFGLNFTSDRTPNGVGVKNQIWRIGGGNAMADEFAKKAFSQATLAAAFSEPALASLIRAGAPLVALDGDAFFFANRAAQNFFGSFDDAELAARVKAAMIRAAAPNPQPGGRPVLARLVGAAASAMFLVHCPAAAAQLVILAGLARGGAPVPEFFSAAPDHADQKADIAAPAARPFPEGGAKIETPSLLGAPAARFLWRADARNVVIQLTPQLAEAVGPGCADLIGRDFCAAADVLGLDPARKLAAALAERKTFGHIELAWPIEGAGAVAPVTLGGLPVFEPGADGARIFDGWRGFGVIHLDRLREGAPVYAPFAAAPAFSKPAPCEDFAGQVSAVVVPLRPLAGPRLVEPASESARPDDEPGLVSLSPHERSAFREIARALGGRNARAEAGAGDALHGEANEPSAGLAAPEQKNPEIFIQSLPFGALVARGDELLFANARALNWLDYADRATLAAAGGLRAALQFSAGDLEAGGRRAILARGAGGAFSADLFRVDIDWDGAPAALFLLARPSAGALEQRAAALGASLRQRENEAEEAFALLDALSDGVALFDRDGRAQGLDRKAELLLDCARHALIGAPLEKFFAAEDLDAVKQAFGLALRGESRSGDFRLRTRGGAIVPVEAAFARIAAADTSSAARVGLALRDLRQRASGRASDQALARAERDSQAKTEFLAKVSHEIRTPLNAILGFAEVIMEEKLGPVGNERYKDYLRDIHASGAHVLSLVNDLLDLSRIESGRLDLALGPVDVNKVIAECVSLMQPQAHRERVITRMALAADLAPIRADERSLRQIALNLIANAVRYNEPGGQVIVSTAAIADGRIALRVKDTGVGMSEEELRLALEPYGQVEPLRPGGAGLGLPLTRALAEANGARFSIRSRKKEGTFVEIAFPIAADQADNLMSSRPA